MEINLAIVGMQKCGTTYLKGLLESHPQITTHSQMEMTYFYRDSEFRKGEGRLREYFPNELEGKVLIKHATLMRSENALERLKDSSPDCKILVCLRNPVKRAFSSYLMESRNGERLEDFEHAVRRACLYEDWSGWRQRVYVGLGDYHTYLKKVYNYFPKSAVRIILLEDLIEDEEGVMTDILSFVGLDYAELATHDASRNEYVTVKSQGAAKMIRSLRSENNLLKRFVKAVLPSKTYLRLSEKIMRSNQKKANKPELKEEMQELLYFHYKKNWKVLADQYGVDVVKWL